MTAENLALLNDISPMFRPFVNYIYQDLNLGLCKAKVSVERIGGVTCCADNQFRLVLPYCSKKLKWDIIFDTTLPWYAPDFRFDDETFLSNTEQSILLEGIPSLAKWDATNPRSLCEVISEMVEMYKIHQINRLYEDDNSRASFEYSALLGNGLTTEQDVEVWVGPHMVEFLIKLKVDTSRLPALYNEGTEANPGIDTALLLVRYPSSTNAELILSPFLTNVLGDITLPPMHQSAVLMDYVPVVTDILNNKIQDLLNNDKLKRELLAQLIVMYGGAILENDTSSAAFLFQTNDFHWVLLIDIAIQFPAKPPILMLRSVYHSYKGKPLYKILSGCSYNNFELYMKQQVEIFKAECIDAPFSLDNEFA